MNSALEDKFCLFVKEDKRHIYYSFCSLKIQDKREDGISFIKQGECTIYKSNLNCAFITYFTIYKEFRGNKLSNQFMKMIETNLKEKKIEYIELEIDELNEKYKKLENLYKEMDFNAIGKERYENRGDYILRRLLMGKRIK
jgi:hypothetical protein